MVGTGRAAEEGILFKGRDSLTRASQVNVVLTDKTGTLTRGAPSLTDLLPSPGGDRAALLRDAVSLEHGSEHPLARAVTAYADRHGVTPVAVRSLESVPGRGVTAEIEGRTVAVVRGTVAREEGIDLSPLGSEVRRLEEEGKTWSVVIDGREPLGLLGFSDEVVPGAREAVDDLRRDGIPVVMVTGDHAAAARLVARATGIPEVRSGVTPQEKLSILREVQGTGKRVAYVGDGINDAPALAAADLGIAIGAGTDVAKETGGVILVRSDFQSVALALRTGRRTVRKVRDNLAWALGYNSVLLPVAAGALVPAFGLGIYAFLPMVGALAMGLSSTTVLLNSLSLRWVSLRA
jgi:P-type E1-E2 ATPase